MPRRKRPVIWDSSSDEGVEEGTGVGHEDSRRSKRLQSQAAGKVVVLRVEARGCMQHFYKFLAYISFFLLSLCLICRRTPKAIIGFRG